MSYKVSKHVASLSNLTITEKAVAFSMAIHANHDGGSVFPSMETIACHAGLRSRRHAAKIVRQLETKGVLLAVSSKIGGRPRRGSALGTTTRYQFLGLGPGNATTQDGCLLKHQKDEPDMGTLRVTMTASTPLRMNAGSSETPVEKPVIERPKLKRTVLPVQPDQIGRLTTVLIGAALSQKPSCIFQAKDKRLIQEAIRDAHNIDEKALKFITKDYISNMDDFAAKRAGDSLATALPSLIDNYVNDKARKEREAAQVKIIRQQVEAQAEIERAESKRRREEEEALITDEL